MNSQRAYFISGTVLGIGVGLLLAHFLRWTPSGPQEQYAHQTGSFSGDLTSHLLGNHTAGSNNFDSPYFPVHDMLDESPLQVPPPLQNALAVESNSPSSPEGVGQLVPVSEPEPLPLSPAIPLPQNTDRDREMIQEIIDIELSHLPEEKRRVWYDALKDVDKEDVAGILKMWKMLGGPIPGTSQGLSPTPSPAELFSTHDLPAAPALVDKEFSQLEEQVQQLMRRNSLLQNTPGYIPQIPTFDTTSAGATVLSPRIAFERTKVIQTGFPLDVAIEGPGFFVVEDNSGNRFLTRLGRFTIDEQRRLALKTGDRTLHVIPEITFPESSNVTTSGDRPSTPSAVRLDSVGHVVLVFSDEQDQEDDRECGKIELRLPASAAALSPVGHVLFALDAFHADILNHVSLEPESKTRLLPGHLEVPDLVAPIRESSADR